MIITQSNREFYNNNKDNYTHIISIVCPDEKDLVKPLNDNHLIVKMWDIAKPLKNKFREYNPPNFLEVMPTVLQPLSWLDEWDDKKQEFRLLIHCDAGISRSSAITLGVLWELSKNIFNPNPDDKWLREYIDARKQWCKSILDFDNSLGLCRYIDGRYNPGVEPNNAILFIIRMYSKYFPW